MTPGRWGRIKKVFHAALDRTESERQAFLEQECASDSGLRWEVERLLREHRETTGLRSPMAAWDPSGRIISHYEVLEKLGGGGMGVVYKARDLKLDRFVALKFLPHDISADEEYKRRFMHEAKAASALDHNNICTVHEVDETDDGRLFIAMACYDGETLKKKIQRGPARLDEALDFAVQVAQGLAKAHHRGIVHRDIKPANVMVTDDGVVKIVDFGLAQLSDVTKLTKTGSTLGTPAYMSPEQVRHLPVDGRTDIWSLGAVLYELVSGRTPFPGDVEVGVAYSILHEEPDPLTAVRTNTPVELEKAVRKALSKAPEERYQQVEEMLVDLRAIKRRLEGGSTKASTPRKVASRSRRVPYAVAAVVSLCALVALVWHSAEVGEGGSAVLRAVPLTSYPGMELYPTLSPDGSQVAFSWLKPGEVATDIYVQQVSGATPLRLTADPAHDWSPSWSPDGKWIAFVRWSDSGPNSLMVMPPLPGTPKKVTDLSIRFSRIPLFRGTSVTWSPDSKWIVVPDRTTPDEPVGLFLLSLETGERRKLTSPPLVGQVDGAPAFSPDSRSLAFIRAQGIASAEIFVIRLSDDLRPMSPASQLTSTRRFVSSPVWTADGRDILFLSGETMKGEQLWRMRLSDTGAGPPRPELLQGPFGASSLLSICFLRDGSTRLAYMRSIFDPNIWALDLKDRSTPAQAPQTLIASTLEDYNPQFLFDDSSIVFQSFRSGTPEIWKSDRDGLNPVQLTSLKGPYPGWPRCSPDGRWIVFHSGPEGASDIYVMKSDGGIPKRLTHEPADDSVASWSRDGRWIYFGSNRSGDRQVWKVRFEPDSPVRPAEPIQVTKGGGYGSLESLDGKMLYYSKGSSLWSVRPGGGEERQVLESVGMQVFVPASDGIYFLARSNPGTPGRIQFLNSSTGKISTVLDLEKPAWLGLSLSLDGRRLLFSQVDREESDLMIVDNWRP